MKKSKVNNCNMHVFARDYVWKSATRVKTQLDIVQLLALDSTRVAVFLLATLNIIRGYYE